MSVDPDQQLACAEAAGAIAFLATDLVPSTRHRSPAPPDLGLAQFGDVVERAVAAHHGTGLGEHCRGSLAMFCRTSDALAAAVEAQRAFSTSSPTRVRMAIHSSRLPAGADRCRATAVDRCVHVRDVGYAGQILVTDAAAREISDPTSVGARLQALGVVQLRDLGRPERVWQVVLDGARAPSSPLRDLDSFAHNLPTRLTPLLGRRDAIDAVVDVLAEDRLVTLSGAGGVGKTRLAIAVAAASIERYPGGVWLVDLAGTGGPATTGRSALRALGISETPGADPARAVAGELRHRGMSLLVLDNCEHTLDDVAAFVATVHDVDPATTVLATSREPLGLEGEVVWRVPSLAVPEGDAPLTVESLSRFDAVALFVERARRAQRSFRLTTDTAPAVADVCQRLDGIPLAIELAAARLRHLPVQRIAAGLDDRFRLLTDRARTPRGRHRTLAASISWSHDLLDEEERIAFRRLGVFRGWFTLEAAECVVACDGRIPSATVFDTVTRLVDKSLLLVDEEDPDGRYRMLESVRSFALARGEDAGETTAIGDARLHWWIEQFRDACRAGPTRSLVGRLTDHLDDVVATLWWASQHDRRAGLDLMRPIALTAIGAEHVGALVPVFERLSDIAMQREDPVRWLRAAVPSAISVRAFRGEKQFVSLVGRCRSVAEAVDDEFYLATCDWYLHKGVRSSEHLRVVAARRDEAFTEAAATVRLAIAAVDERPDVARESLAAAHDAATRGASRYLHDYAAVAEAAHAATLGDYARCVEIGRALAQHGISSVRRHAFDHLLGAGLATGDERAIAEAKQLAEAAVRCGVEPSQQQLRMAVGALALLGGGGERREPISLESHALISCRDAVDRGEPLVDHSETASIRPESVVHHAHLHLIDAWRDDDQDQWYAALDLAVRYGLRPVAIEVFEGLAASASAAGSASEAIRLLGAAERLRDETDARWRFRIERRRHALVLARVRETLGDRVDAAWNEGRQLDWREAAEYVRRGRGERARPRHGWASLTPTESRVVELVVLGDTNREIANRLIMSRSTVKTHLEHVFVKTGVRNRSQLAAESVARSALREAGRLGCSGEQPRSG
jgi:predicted ATPase/DNA-binding CsgD family transcriptional regulator